MHVYNCVGYYLNVFNLNRYRNPKSQLKTNVYIYIIDLCFR